MSRPMGQQLLVTLLCAHWVCPVHQLGHLDVQMSKGAEQVQAPSVCLVVSVTLGRSSSLVEGQSGSTAAQETFWLPQEKSGLFCPGKWLKCIRFAAARSPCSQAVFFALLSLTFLREHPWGDLCEIQYWTSSSADLCCNVTLPVSPSLWGWTLWQSVAICNPLMLHSPTSQSSQVN